MFAWIPYSQWKDQDLIEEIKKLSEAPGANTDKSIQNLISVVDELGRRATALIDNQYLIDTDLYTYLNGLVRLQGDTTTNRKIKNAVEETLKKDSNASLRQLLAGLKGMQKAATRGTSNHGSDPNNGAVTKDDLQRQIRELKQQMVTANEVTNQIIDDFVKAIKEVEDLLKGRLQELNKNPGANAAEIEKLQSTIASLQRAAIAPKNPPSGKQERSAHDNSINSQLNALVKELQEELLETSQLLDTTNGKYKKALTELDNAGNLLKSVTAENENLKSQLVTLNTRLDIVEAADREKAHQLKHLEEQLRQANLRNPLASPVRNSNDLVNIEAFKQLALQKEVADLEARLNRNSAEGQMFQVIADKIETELLNIGLYQSNIDGIRQEIEAKAQQTEDQLRKAQQQGSNHNEIEALRRQLQDQKSLVAKLKNPLDSAPATAAVAPPHFSLPPSHPNDVEQRYQDLQTRFANLEESYEAYKDKATQSQDLVSKKEKELETARSQIAEGLKNLETLTKEQTKWFSERSALERDIARLNKELSAEQQKSQKEAERATQYEKTSAEKTAQFLRDARTIHDLEEKIKELREQLASLEQEKLEVTGEATLTTLQNKTEIEELRSQISIKTKEIETLQAELRKAKATVEKEQLEKETLTSAYERTQAEKEKIENILKQVQEELRVKTSELANLKGAHHALIQTDEKQGKHIGELEAQIEVKTKEISLLQQQLNEIKDESRQVVSDNADLQRQIDLLKSNEQDLIDKVEKLEGQIKTEGTYHEKQVAFLNQRVADLEREINEHTGELTALQAQVSNLESQLKAKGDEIASLQEQLKSAQLALEEAKNKASTQQTQHENRVNGFKKYNADLSTIMETLKEKVKGDLTRINELEKRLKEKTEGLEQLESSSKDAQQKLSDEISSLQSQLKDSNQSHAEHAAQLREQLTVKEEALLEVQKKLDMAIRLAKEEILELQKALSKEKTERKLAENQWSSVLSSNTFENALLKQNLKEYEKREEELSVATRHMQNEFDKAKAFYESQIQELDQLLDAKSEELQRFHELYRVRVRNDIKEDVSEVARTEGIKELTEKVSELERQLKAGQREKARLQESVWKEQSALKISQTKLEEVQNELVRVKQELSTAQTTITEKENELKLRKSNLEALRQSTTRTSLSGTPQKQKGDDRTRLEKTVNELSFQLNSHITEKQKLEKQLKEQTDKIAKLEATLRESNKVNFAGLETLQKLQQELLEANKKEKELREDYQRKIDIFVDKEAEYQKQIQGLSNTINSLKSLSESQNSKLEAATLRIEELESRLNAPKQKPDTNRFAELEKQIPFLQNDVKVAETASKEAQKGLKQSQAQNEKLTERITMVEKKNKDLLESESQLSSKNQELEKTVQQLRRENEKLKRDNTQLDGLQRETFSEFVKESDRALKKTRNVESKEAALLKRAETAESEVTQLRNELAKLRGELTFSPAKVKQTNGLQPDEG